MKFKLLLSIAVALATSFFIVSCDDDIDTIGSGIQPGIDDIFMEVGEVDLTAETVDLGKNLYMRTNRALLGVLNDPIMGKTKSDFMAEFFCANAKFTQGHDGKAQIDSVFFYMRYENKDVMGDTLSPMGVTVYELDKKLDPNFYTSVDVSKYTDKSKILAQRFFLHSELNIVSDNQGHYGKYMMIEMDRNFGQRLYDAWLEDKSVLKSTENLREILHGIYVTTEFNDKALIEFPDVNLLMNVRVHYSYLGKKKNEPTIDSVFTDVLPLQINGGALQLNSVVDTPNKEIFEPSTGKTARTYAKAPSGIATKITIPLADIRKLALDKIGSENYTINSATFNLTGMSEAEKELKITKRPTHLLFANETALDSIFLYSKLVDGLSSLVMQRDYSINQSTGLEIENSGANAYHFLNPSTNSLTNNISSLINHHIIKEKDEEEKTDKLVFYVIPVDMLRESNSIETYVRNTLSPSAAIFRTDKDNMKMSLVFSKYSDIK